MINRVDKLLLKPLKWLDKDWLKFFAYLLAFFIGLWLIGIISPHWELILGLLLLGLDWLKHFELNLIQAIIIGGIILFLLVLFLFVKTAQLREAVASVATEQILLRHQVEEAVQILYAFGKHGNDLKKVAEELCFSDEYELKAKLEELGVVF